MIYPLQSPLKSKLLKAISLGLLLMTILAPLMFHKPSLVEAKPYFVPSPIVSVNAPSQMMIGEEFSFTVTFDNVGADEGYGPYIDVVFPTQGSDGVFGDSLNPADGIAYISGGSYSGISLTCQSLTFNSSGELTHPYHRDTTGNYSTVSGTPGDTFVSCLLPFGSFVPEQPAAEVTFQASLSDEADAGSSLVIRANGGFQYGADPLDNWCCDDALPSPYPANSSEWTSTSSVTPTILTLNKTYSGPENETATGPNYPRQFTVTVDVAENQTINNFVLQDILPENLQFISLDAISGNGSTTIIDLSTPSTSSPGGTISRGFDSIIGTASRNDAVMTFSFYIPRDDTSSNRVIDTVSGDDVISANNAYASGDWDPIDDRDDPAVVSGGSAGPPAEYNLTDKSIAIQKDVTNLSPPLSPDDILEYTHSIQISDYFAFEDLVITDLISDGQHVLDSSQYIPRVAVNGNNGYTLSAVEMDSANYDVSCDYSGTQGSECTLDDGSPYTGDTILELRISDELITQGRNDGNLLGGCVPVGGGTADCSIQDDGPTTITVTYQTVILQEFVDDFPSGDPSVDQGDQLNNSVTISGDVLDNITLNPQGTAEEDGSSAGITINRDNLQKEFFAINGSTSIPSPVRISPGNEITFQLIYDLVTSDVEDLYITDFLPLPVLEVDDYNADGTGGDVWAWTSGTDGKCANLPVGELIASGIPASGFACFGTGDSFYDYSGITPTLTKDVPANSLEFYYGHYDDIRDQSTRVEILFTITVNNEPYADGLFFTNQAQVHEGSTNSGNQFTDTIIDFILEEPYLVLDKGAVASDNSNAIFNPDPPGPVTFDPPGSAGQRWTGIISSSGLETNPISSAVSDVDAGDLVSFALVIENQGSSPNGAFDIKIRDIIPPGFSIPAGGAGLNLSVFRGDGNPVSYLPLGTAGDDTDLFDQGLELVDPGSVGVCQEYDAADGENIIVITYDLQVDDDIAPGSEMENLGEVFNYANTEGGPDFTGDDADLEASTTTTTTLPEISKTFQTTNQTFTADRDVAIGEIVTYQTVLTVPEGQSTGVTLVDTLDLGLAFDDLAAMSISADADLGTSVGTFNDVLNNGVISSQGTGDDNQGRALTLDFGTITNSNRDNNTPETITLTYDVVVINGGGNNSGATRNNDAVWTWNLDGVDETISDSALDVTILEPELQVQKTVVPTRGDSGDTVSYTILIDHTTDSDTDAYDVEFSDLIPADATYVASSLSCSEAGGLVVADTCAESGGTITASYAGPFEIGHSATIAFDVTLDISVTPGEVITNTGEVEWTSLPGDVTTTQSAENTLTVERTGDDTNPGGTENDYTASDDADVDIDVTEHTKYLRETSESHTIDPEVTIGEIVRYRLVTQVPEGTSPNFQIQDRLPDGLLYLENTAKAYFVYTNDNNKVPGGISSSDISDPDCYLDLSSPIDTTTVSIPSSCDFIPDLNVGSDSSTTTDPDSYSSGTDPYIKLGTVVNNDNDDQADYVILEFNALVDNTAGGSNDAGDSRQNDFIVRIDGNLIGSPSNRIEVTIAEPELTITKTLSSGTADGNDPVQYTLIISNPNGLYDATAFDLSVTDVFDAYIDSLSLDTISTTQGGNCSGGTPYSDSGSGSGSLTGTNLSFSASCLDPGQTITLVLSGTLDPDIPAGYNLENLAQLAWTSLPADGTSPNGTDSTTPGVSGSGTGERDDSGGVNDYADSDNANRTLDAPEISKTISPDEYTIGDLFTYDLLVTLPEGITRDIVIVDNIPAGLEYVSHTLITAAAASGGLLSADFNGVFANNPPSANSPSGSGADLTLNFGDTDTEADNNPDNDSFLVQVSVRVLDAAGNYDSVVRTNQGRVEYTNPNTSGTSTVSDSADITIIEPWITTAKTVSPATSVEAGDTLTYTVRFTNNGNSPAYEVTALDTLAQGISFSSLTSCLDESATPVPSTVTDNGATISFDGDPAGSWDIPVNEYIECAYTATAETSLYMNGGHINTVDADWSNQDETVSGERIYDDRGSSPVDDDRDQDDALFSSDAPTLTKDDGGVTQVVIGDTITFTLTIGGELGTYRDLVIEDQLPAGLIFNEDTSLSGFGSSPSESFTTPNDGSAAVTITWDFGDVYKNASAASITYSARVADVSSNIEGHGLINNVTLDHNRADGTAAAQLTDQETSQIVEPEITTTKSASPTSGVDAGDTVTYTTRYTNTGSGTAYEVTAEDLLPADVDYNTDASCEYFDGTSTSSISVTITGTTTLSFGTWDIPVGHYVECQYSITTQLDIELGTSHGNTVDADWSSQDGSQATERIYDDGLTGPVDDGLQDQDSASFVTGSPTTLTKDDGGITQAVIGDLIHITLTIDTPLGTLRAASVEDILPTGMVYVSGSQTVSGNISAASFSTSSPNDGSAAVTLTWDFGDAAVTGSPVVIEYDARTANVAGNIDGTNLVNEVTLSYIDDGGPQTLTDSDDVSVIEPLLVIDKSTSNPTPALGETVTFTLEISHDPASSADAYDLVLKDTVPAGYTYVGGSLTHDSGTSPDQLLDSGAPDLSAAWNSFPRGSASVLTYQATLDADLSPGDNLTNTAILTWTSQSGPDANERDGSGGINDYRDEDTVTSTATNPDLRVTKDDGQTDYIPGTSQVYDIWVYNDGNGDVTGALVSDNIPPQVESWTWVCAEENGGAAGCDGAASTALNFGDYVDLPAGSSLRYTVTAQILSSAAGPLTNTVQVSPPSGVEEPTPGNNTASDTDARDSQADLSVSKDDGLTIIAPNTTLTYTVVVENNGPSDAVGVEIEDALPVEITAWDWVCSGATGGAVGCDGVSGSTVDFSDTINLPASATLTYTVTANVSSTASGTLTNTITVSTPAEVTDMDLSNNTASDTDAFADHSKALSSTNQAFTATPDAAVGEILTYQIRLTVPAGEMTSLNLTDVMDRGLAFLDCESISASSPDLTTSVGGGFDAVCSSPTVSAVPSASPEEEDAGRQAVFDFGTLTNSGAGDIDLVVTYRVVALDNLGNQSGINLDNQAAWVWSGGSLSDSADQVTVREPDLEFSKSVSPRSAFPGQTVTFTLTIGHTSISETPAYDVTLTDIVPAGLTYVPGSLRHVSGQVPDTLDEGSAPTLTVIWDELLNNGINSTISFDVTLDSTLRRGERVENTAALAWTSLPGDISNPQSAYNMLSTERFYDPGSAVNVYGLEASAAIQVPALPDTGFAPRVITEIPEQPAGSLYSALDNLQLEIPRLSLSLPIVGIPQDEEGWNLTWLGHLAGWLEGTAFPTWKGNTALTAHVYLANGAPGPFVDLDSLVYGDEIYLLAHGQKYIYQVRSRQLVPADDLSILSHRERDWLTLFTCRGYSAYQEEYLWRQSVQAVLIQIEEVE
ncbi:MAG: sortase [Anaerolineales bacterium]|nr:sortase [Anaerolineales bacterium]